MTDAHRWFNGRKIAVCETFFSIKNQVYLVLDTDNKKKILKVFRTRESLLAEKENLYRFSPLSPPIFEESEAALLMEYIAGRNVLDLYLELEKVEADVEKLAKQLNQSLQCLYDLAPGYRLGDINLRNFIFDVKRDMIRFVDYEESCLGEQEEDAGRLLAFLLTYRPVDTEWKRKFVVCLAKLLVCSGQNIDLICYYAQDELESISKRRKNSLVYLPAEFPKSIS